MEELDGETGEDSLDGMLQNLIFRAIQGHQAQTNPNSSPYVYNPLDVGMSDVEENAVVSNLATAQTQQIQRVHVTDQQLEGIWQTIPVEQKPFIKMQSDGVISSWIRANYPQIDEDSVERAIKFVREQ